MQTPNPNRPPPTSCAHPTPGLGALDRTELVQGRRGSSLGPRPAPWPCRSQKRRACGPGPRVSRDPRVTHGEGGSHGLREAPYGFGRRSPPCRASGSFTEPAQDPAAGAAPPHPPGTPSAPCGRDPAGAPCTQACQASPGPGTAGPRGGRARLCPGVRVPPGALGAAPTCLPGFFHTKHVSQESNRSDELGVRALPPRPPCPHARSRSARPPDRLPSTSRRHRRRRRRDEPRAPRRPDHRPGRSAVPAASPSPRPGLPGTLCTPACL